MQVLPAEDTLRPPEYVRPGAKSAWPSRPPSAPWALPPDQGAQEPFAGERGCAARATPARSASVAAVVKAEGNVVATGAIFDG
jgi:hypothetical protein